MTAPGHENTNAQSEVPETVSSILATLAAVTSSLAATPEKSSTADSDAARRDLDALAAVRELRHALDRWEPRLIETARGHGATWADLAPPLGVASRQAAERRYLRIRETAVPTGATQDERVKAERDRRAAERSITAWARANPTALRGLAGQIAALDTAAYGSRRHLTVLRAALVADDPALLLQPLADLAPRLAATRPDLAAQIETLTRRADEPRRADDPRHDGDDRRSRRDPGE